MSEQSNIATIQGIFDAFGRGDVPSILASINPDVRWVNPGPSSVPYARKRRGLDEVREFFDAIYGNLDVTAFEPREFIASGDRVVSTGSWSGNAKPSGRPFTSEWSMTWTLRNGKVTSFQVYEDTHAVAQAFGAPSTAAAQPEGMVVVRFKAKCKPEKSEQAMAVFREVVAASRALPGVVSFDIARDLTDANTIIATEVFKDRATLTRQEALPAVQTAIGMLEEVLAGEPEATVFHVSSSQPWGA